MPRLISLPFCRFTTFYRRTADVRSVGYSELFSLSREDVLAAMKDYPEAQEILQKLGRKRLMEAQKVTKPTRQPTSPGHDSSDNSTGKRIVDKLKSDVKGLKNALRKSRRNTRPEESLELQPLTPKVTTLKRQQKVDDGQEAPAPSVQEPPVSPLGAGLPLLARLRLLKEKEEREILLMKSKPEQEATVDKEPVKEPLLPKNSIPEEPKIAREASQQSSEPTPCVEVANEAGAKKPWAMLKDASITNKENSPQRSPPVRRWHLKQSLVHLRQQTKMYASVDDLSPEYCGLPFVKKLKILNERQKLAELEKAVRSSSLDCGDNAEMEFDGNLTRSHSEACAIEYARKLEKLNQNRQSSLSPTDQLSPENETLERRNLKSILKKLSAGSRTGSRTGSSETLATSTPDREAATAELRKLMRAPTIEGYAARHSKLSKSVTFNKYTLQSPPSEQITGSYPFGPQFEAQDQASLPPPNKLSFRPLGSGGYLQIVPVRQREEEYLGELVSDIREIVKGRLEDIQTKFERQFTSLQLEIRKRDEIISQLQARIQELEQRESRNDSQGDGTEHDASLEEDLDDDREDHPFMRDGSMDTVLTTRPYYNRSTIYDSSSQNRRSWEEHSEEETLELQELPRSIVPHSLWKDEVAIDVESNSESSKRDDESDRSCRTDSENEDDEEEEERRRRGHNNWEVAMLAQELESRRRSSENANPDS